MTGRKYRRWRAKALECETGKGIEQDQSPRRHQHRSNHAQRKPPGCACLKTARGNPPRHQTGHGTGSERKKERGSDNGEHSSHIQLEPATGLIVS